MSSSNLVWQVSARAVQEQRADRLLRIRNCMLAYQGYAPQPLLPTKPDPYGLDNITPNLAALAIDKIVSLLFGTEGVRLIAPDPTSQKALDQLWKMNTKGGMLPKMGVMGAISGDVFLKLNLVQDMMGKTVPKLCLWDSANVEMDCAEDDMENMLECSMTWTYSDPKNPNNTKVMRQRIVRNGATWQIIDEESIRDSKVWRITNQVDWPFIWAPVFHSQNLPIPNSIYGKGNIDDGVDVLNDYNTIMSDICRILRLYAHPRTIATGLTTKNGVNLDVAIDKMIALPEKVEIKNLEMQSDLAGSQAYADKLKSLYWQIVRLPDVAGNMLEKVGKLPSGVALKLMYEDTRSMIGQMRMCYGEMLEEVAERMLELNGYVDREVEIEWPDTFISDDADMRNNLMLDQQMGVVSKETMARKLGYEWETEGPMVEKEATNMGDAMLANFSKP